MTYNPYVIQCCDQEGCTETDVRRDMQKQSPKKREFPCEIFGRRFETKAQYLEELHEFLNSN